MPLFEQFNFPKEVKESVYHIPLSDLDTQLSDSQIQQTQKLLENQVDWYSFYYRLISYF